MIATSVQDHQWQADPPMDHDAAMRESSSSEGSASLGSSELSDGSSNLSSEDFRERSDIEGAPAFPREPPGHDLENEAGQIGSDMDVERID